MISNRNRLSRLRNDNSCRKLWTQTRARGIRCAPEAATSPQRQQRLADLHIFHQQCRKFLGTRPAQNGLLAVSMNVMLWSCSGKLLAVDRCPQPMKPTGRNIMHHVIFARPRELDRPLKRRAMTAASPCNQSSTLPKHRLPRLVYDDFSCGRPNARAILLRPVSGF